MFQERFKAVYRKFHGCFKEGKRVLQGSFKSVSRKIQGNFKDISQSFKGVQVRLKVISSSFKGGLREVLMVFHEYFIEVFSRSFKEVSRVLQ